MGFLDATGITTLVTKLKDKFALKSEVERKQDILISGTNIKTINGSTLLESGNLSITDTNDTAYKIRYYGAAVKAYSTIYSNHICFSRLDGTLLPTNAVNNAVATNKTLTTEAFDPFGQIYYYSRYSAVSAGSSIAGDYVWIKANFDLRHSFNTGSTLTIYAPIYVKCSPQTDGQVKLAGDDCIVQSLPSTEDGYVYIYLGRAQTSQNIELDAAHPIYYYKGGALRQWTNAESGGGSGGINKLILYTSTSFTNVYIDSGTATTFLESCDYDYRTAIDTMLNADIIEVWYDYYISSNANPSYAKKSVVISIDYDYSDDSLEIGIIPHNQSQVTRIYVS